MKQSNKCSMDLAELNDKVVKSARFFDEGMEIENLLEEGEGVFINRGIDSFIITFVDGVKLFIKPVAFQGKRRLRVEVRTDRKKCPYRRKGG